MERITFYRIPTNEPWCRDHGPIFLTRNERWSRLAPKPRHNVRREGALAPLVVVDWDYNAWGNKYPPFNLDEVVPMRVAEILRVPVFYPHVILEGGSIDVNGAGALLTTESCLLNENRNRLPRVDLGLRHFSLPHPATTSDLIGKKTPNAQLPMPNVELRVGVRCS